MMCEGCDLDKGSTPERKLLEKEKTIWFNPRDVDEQEQKKIENLGRQCH